MKKDQEYLNTNQLGVEHFHIGVLKKILTVKFSWKSAHFLGFMLLLKTNKTRILKGFVCNFMRTSLPFELVPKQMSAKVIDSTINKWYFLSTQHFEPN